MKSFSEYIKEAYNFRLGGSQRKGFGQTEGKPFEKIQVDDTIYFVAKYYDSQAHDAKVTNAEFVQRGLKLHFEILDNEHNATFISKSAFLKFIGNEWKPDSKVLNCGSYISDNFWVISTDIEALADEMRKVLKGKDLEEFEKSIPKLV